MSANDDDDANETNDNNPGIQGTDTSASIAFLSHLFSSI
jgi:hypothetical protein